MKTGGPAFPAEFRNNGDRNVTCPNGELVPPGGVSTAPGMTLRDYFAAAALTGFMASLADPKHRDVLYSKNQGTAHIVNACYVLADAMLAERDKP